MKPLAESAQLTVQIEGDDLVIRIGSALLLHAVQNGANWDGTMEITDPEKFLGEIVRELESESEDGTTLLHIAFDKAALNAVENGSEYVDDGYESTNDDAE